MLDPPRLGGSRRDAFDCIGCDRVGSDGGARESFSRVWEDWQVMSRGREPGSHEGGRPRRRRMLMLTILLSSGGWAVMGPGLRTSSPAWSVVGRARPVKRGSFLAAHTSKSRLISSAGAEWVSAPTEMTWTPVAAIAATVVRLTPPEASLRARPPMSV